MSRVDDDRDAARMAARLAEQRRLDEGKKKDQAQQSNAFKKLMGQQKQAAQTAQADTTARDVLSHLLEQQEAGGDTRTAQERGAQQKHESAFKSRMGTKGMQDKVQRETRKETNQGLQAKVSDQQGSEQATSGRAADQGAATSKSESRQTDAAHGKESLEERKESSDADSSNRAAGAAGGKGGKGALKTDTEGGGQKGGGNKDSKDSNSMGPGFRFNPALMAPVPVKQKKEVAGSERLRKVANELAQKIVENVRVGTNSLGNAEFQIDLRGNVLSGMSVKVSAKNGKISAVFSGSDKDVLKMVEEQGEALGKALESRGLKLEAFRVEART